MISINHSFQNIEDPKIIARLTRSADIKVINRFDGHFDAINTANNHTHRVEIAALDITCSCPDSTIRGNSCKHEIAVLRDMNIFESDEEKHFRLLESSFEEDWHERRYQEGL